MAYKRKPNYHFAVKTDTGIDNVPVGRIVVCEDFNGEVKSYVLKNKTSITGATTIEQAVGAANLVEDKVTIDATPTNGSNNAVSSDGVFDGLATKQATLVSGTNIKTVNGTSILGSGGITIDTAAYDAAHNFATNGYQKLANGWVIQWGIITSATTSTAVTFPLAFPNVVRSITLGDEAETTGGNAQSAGVYWTGATPTRFGFTLSSQTGTTTYWTAIGY